MRLRWRVSVAARPVTLSARKSPTGTAIRLDSDGLAVGVHSLLMMSASTAVYLPLLIHTLAVAKNKTAALAQVARERGSAGLAGSGGGESVIVYPIRCAVDEGAEPGRAILRQAAAATIWSLLDRVADPLTHPAAVAGSGKAAVASEHLNCPDILARRQYESQADGDRTLCP